MKKWSVFQVSMKKWSVFQMSLVPQYRYDLVALFLLVTYTFYRFDRWGRPITILEAIWYLSGTILMGLPAFDLRKRLQPGGQDWGTKDPVRLEELKRPYAARYYVRLAILAAALLYLVSVVIFQIRVHQVMQQYPG